MRFLANSEVVFWMREHATEYAQSGKPHPVSDLATQACYKFADDYGGGPFGMWRSYLYYHQAAELFKEMKLDPGQNDIEHEANYSAGCQRYH